MTRIPTNLRSWVLFGVILGVAVRALTAPNQFDSGHGGGSGTATSTTTFEQNVNLANESNPCSAIQSAIKTLNDGSDSKPFFRFYGEADITWSDFHLAKWKNLGDSSINDSVYKYCFAEIPSATFENTYYPIADGTGISANIEGRIFFDNVRLNVDCTGQDMPGVVWQAGGGWLNGRTSTTAQGFYGGYFSNAPTVDGYLTIKYTGDCDLSRTAGATFSRSPERLFESNGTSTSTRTMVGLYVQGVQRRGANNLRLEVDCKLSDNDDIGVIVEGAANWTFGASKIVNCGYGILLAGSVLTDFNSWYFTQDDYSIVYGDPTYGGDPISAENCVADTDTGGCGRYMSTTPRGVNSSFWIAGVAEGSTNGEVTMFEAGSPNTFTDVHLEGSGPGNHTGNATVIGAGYCSGGTTGKDFAVGSQAQCDYLGGGGTFKCAKADFVGFSRAFFDTRFMGGSVGGSTSPGTEFANLFIGDCATQSNGYITLNTQLLQSYNGATPVAFRWGDTLGTGGPTIDVTGVPRTGNFIFPDYPKLRSGTSISIPFRVDIPSATFDPTGASNYLPIATWNGAAGVASTDATAFVPIEYNHINRWQVHRIDCGNPVAYAGDEDLNFIPVFADYDHNNTTPITATGNPSNRAGHNIAANTVMSAEFFEDTSLVMGSNRAMIGVKVTGTGNEVHEACALTLMVY